MGGFLLTNRGLAGLLGILFAFYKVADHDLVILAGHAAVMP
jgi:hypothetical protein